MTFCFLQIIYISMEGSEVLIREFFYTSTPEAIAILILCILIENKFPDAFKGNSKRKKIKVSIDLSDWRQVVFLVIAVGVILLTPVINLLVSITYSFFVIYQIYRNYRR